MFPAVHGGANREQLLPIQDMGTERRPETSRRRIRFDQRMEFMLSSSHNNSGNLSHEHQLSSSHKQQVTVAALLAEGRISSSRICDLETSKCEYRSNMAAPVEDISPASLFPSV